MTLFVQGLQTQARRTCKEGLCNHSRAFRNTTEQVVGRQLPTLSLFLLSRNLKKVPLPRYFWDRKVSCLL